MGITARGAWESVKRHFRELGTDIQTQDFTVVGVGDMSGDVFGNGMLLSRHIRLVGAFNHLHIFVDPDPDPEASWQERKRLFDLPRSAWTDYDAKLISPGGGVFDRKAKAIPLTPEMRRCFGIETDRASLTPAELIRAMLRAPVDLLWMGGIGTYVKASTARTTRFVSTVPSFAARSWAKAPISASRSAAASNTRFAAGASTRTRSTTPAASIARTTRSTSRSRSTR